MASKTQDGKSETPVFPWSLRFEPNSAFKFPSTVAAGYVDFMKDLATIKSGTVLYTVYAMNKPKELGGTELKIAQIRTTSQMTTSNWSDEHLFFRHQRMDDDLKLKPEWLPYTPKYEGLFSLE